MSELFMYSWIIGTFSITDVVHIPLCAIYQVSSRLQYQNCKDLTMDNQGSTPLETLEL